MPKGKGNKTKPKDAGGNENTLQQLNSDQTEDNAEIKIRLANAKERLEKVQQVIDKLGSLQASTSQLIAKTCESSLLQNNGNDTGMNGEINHEVQEKQPEAIEVENGDHIEQSQTLKKKRNRNRNKRKGNAAGETENGESSEPAVEEKPTSLETEKLTPLETEKLNGVKDNEQNTLQNGSNQNTATKKRNKKNKNKKDLNQNTQENNDSAEVIPHEQTEVKEDNKEKKEIKAMESNKVFKEDIDNKLCKESKNDVKNNENKLENEKFCQKLWDILDEPSKTESSKAEPLKTEPLNTEPSKTEPSKTEPSKTKPPKTELSKTEQSKTVPSKTVPSKAEPSKTEPLKTEPSKTEPSKTVPSKTEPSKTEPSEVEPFKTESSKTKSSKTETSKIEPSKTKPSKTEPSKTEPSKTEPSKTEPSKTESSKAEPSKTEPSKTEPSKVEPPKTESTKTEPAKTEPTKTEPKKNKTAKIEPAKTEPPKIEPAKTKIAKTEPAKTEPAKAEPPKTESSKTEPSKIEPSKIEPSKIEPSKLEPSKTELSRTELSTTEPQILYTNPIPSNNSEPNKNTKKRNKKKNQNQIVVEDDKIDAQKSAECENVSNMESQNLEELKKIEKVHDKLNGESIGTTIKTVEKIEMKIENDKSEMEQLHKQDELSLKEAKNDKDKILIKEDLSSKPNMEQFKKADEKAEILENQNSKKKQSKQRNKNKSKENENLESKLEEESQLDSFKPSSENLIKNEIPIENDTNLIELSKPEKGTDKLREQQKSSKIDVSATPIDAENVSNGKAETVVEKASITNKTQKSFEQEPNHKNGPEKYIQSQELDKNQDEIDQNSKNRKDKKKQQQKSPPKNEPVSIKNKEKEILIESKENCKSIETPINVPILNHLQTDTSTEQNKSLILEQNEANCKPHSELLKTEESKKIESLEFQKIDQSNNDNMPALIQDDVTSGNLDKNQSIKKSEKEDKTATPPTNAFAQLLSEGVSKSPEVICPVSKNVPDLIRKESESKSTNVSKDHQVKSSSESLNKSKGNKPQKNECHPNKAHLIKKSEQPQKSKDLKSAQKDSDQSSKNEKDSENQIINGGSVLKDHGKIVNVALESPIADKEVLELPSPKEDIKNATSVEESFAILDIETAKEKLKESLNNEFVEIPLDIEDKNPKAMQTDSVITTEEPPTAKERSKTKKEQKPNRKKSSSPPSTMPPDKLVDGSPPQQTSSQKSPDTESFDTESKNVQGSGFARSAETLVDQAESLGPSQHQNQLRNDKNSSPTTNKRNKEATNLMQLGRIFESKTHDTPEKTPQEKLEPQCSQVSLMNILDAKMILPGLKPGEITGTVRKIPKNDDRKKIQLEDQAIDGRIKSTKNQENQTNTNKVKLEPDTSRKVTSPQPKKALPPLPPLPDEDEEFIEYKFTLREIFVCTLCQICKNNLQIFIPCSLCQMVFYCSEEHLLADQPSHQALCGCIQEIAKKRGGHIYNNARILSDDDFRCLRVHTLNTCENMLKRQLQPYEREILLFPRICSTNSCREWRSQLLAQCKDCGQVSYCSSNPIHLSETHKQWCMIFKLYTNLVMTQKLMGRIEPSLPSKIMAKTYHLPPTIDAVFKDLYRNYNAIKDECIYATLTQLATAPLTAYFASQKCAQKIGETYTIHLIGAELQFEADTLDKYETFFLHLIPDLFELRVVFIGPELNMENLPLEILSRMRMCRACRQNCRAVKFDFQCGKLYHDYVKNAAFTKPDLICFFNPGLYRSTGFNGIDSWPETIQSAASLNCPIVITSYTAIESPKDLERLQKESQKQFTIIQEPFINPYTSQRPERNFMSDEIAPMIFKNFYCFIVQ